MTQSHAVQAHRQAMIVDRRHYVTLARNAVCELRMSRATKRHFLHVTNSASYMLTLEQANAVYAVIVRHVVRLATKQVTTKQSVYTLRSDIRALMRAIECSKFAH